MTATRKWSALTVLLIAAVLIASWFLLITPKRTEAAGLRAQKVEQDATNERLEQQMEVLKAQALDLPKQEAFLAQIRRQLPDNPALPALVRDLTNAARKAGLTLESLAPSDPVAVVDVTPVAVAPTTPPAEESSEGTTPVAAPVAPAAPTLFQVPIVVKASGSYFEVEQFINKIEALKRSFLVSGFTLKPGADKTESEQLEISVTGRVFLSPAQAAAVQATTVVAPAPSTAPAAN
jgi:type IV pilus assembly protein PilO